MDAEIIQNTWDFLSRSIVYYENFLIDNELPLAFLHGIVSFPLLGISSLHLHGYFNLMEGNLIHDIFHLIID